MWDEGALILLFCSLPSSMDDPSGEVPGQEIVEEAIEESEGEVGAAIEENHVHYALLRISP